MTIKTFYSLHKDCIWVCLIPVLFFLLSFIKFTPSNIDNACDIFQEKSDWFDAANDSSKHWGIKIPVLLAIIHQESKFVADAKPPRVWLWGVIPWGRISSAYGYAQALNGTWNEYRDSDGSFFANRDDFEDAVDFVGWYCRKIHNELGISLDDAQRLYLAYYEGIEGYRQRNYAKKSWLQKGASEVAKRTKLFQQQLNSCQIN